MKVDKGNPRHWLYLILFGLNALIAVVIRPLTKSKRGESRVRNVILYGHRLSGNLLALHRHINKHHGDEFQLIFITMDPKYHQQLRDQGVNACWAGSPSAIQFMCAADAVISDHGLHSLQIMLGRSDLKFFDVWHGIPFKGFSATDFHLQHRYTETWVASPLLVELYTERYGFDPSQVAVTGYARTDPLIEAPESPLEIRRRLGLQHINGQRLVLFAPTWKQDAQHRNLFPFATDGTEFLESITEVCSRNGALLLFRAHLNAKDPVPLPASGVIPVPFADYPDTEAILQISDVLICDWSSIAFDYLLLDRPTLFLDVEAPFRKGFSLGREYRFGPVIQDLPDLIIELERSLADPEGYTAEFGARHAAIREQVYGNYADGLSAERCVQRLRRELVKGVSSR